MVAVLGPLLVLPFFTDIDYLFSNLKFSLSCSRLASKSMLDSIDSTSWLISSYLILYLAGGSTSKLWFLLPYFISFKELWGMPYTPKLPFELIYENYCFKALNKASLCWLLILIATSSKNWNKHSFDWRALTKYFKSVMSTFVCIFLALISQNEEEVSTNTLSWA